MRSSINEYRLGGVMVKNLQNVAGTVYRNCFALKENEKVLVVTDGHDLELANCFYTAAAELGKEALIIRFLPRTRHGEEPPDSIDTLMQTVDVAVLSTSYSLSHTRARRRASETGARIASMPMLTAEMALRTLNIDYETLSLLTQKYVEMLTKGREARITSPSGTDLTVKLGERSGILDAGQLSYGGACGNLPAGEAFIAPLEGSGEGMIVFDGSLAGWGMLEEHVKISVQNGRAVEISGGKAAQWLIQALDERGENARNIAELGIGTNAKARLSGVIIEDEKAYGTAHIALGDNKGIGGTVEAGIHVDGMIINPSITVDGQIISEKGELLL